MSLSSSFHEQLAGLLGIEEDNAALDHLVQYLGCDSWDDLLILQEEDLQSNETGPGPQYYGAFKKKLVRRRLFTLQHYVELGHLVGPRTTFQQVARAVRHDEQLPPNLDNEMIQPVVPVVATVLEPGRELSSGLRYKDQGRNVTAVLPPVVAAQQEAGLHQSEQQRDLPSTLDYKDQGRDLESIMPLPDRKPTAQSTSPPLFHLSRFSVRRHLPTGDMPLRDSASVGGEKSKKRRRLIFIAILGFLAVAAGGSAAFWYATNADDDEDLSAEGSAPTDTLNSSNQLRAAIVAYVSDNSPVSSAARSYGWPIGSWDVSRITDMRCMFRAFPSEFCQNTFQDAAVLETFNEDISSWNVTAVTDMYAMFYGAKAFDKSLNSWNVAAVTDMYAMFFDAIAFNQALNNWNVASATDISFMFRGATQFNRPLDSWNVAAVTSMQATFARTDAFNQPLDNWNVASVTNMIAIFSSATLFNQPVSRWNVDAVTAMRRMFSNATSFNQPLDSWNVASVADMSQMFKDAQAFNQDLCSWGPQFDAAVSTSDMFLNTQCPVVVSPVLTANPVGPLCYTCN